MKNSLTEQQLKIIREIRAMGFAVIVWSPEEMGNASRKYVEDRSIELGHEVIKDLQ